MDSKLSIFLAQEWEYKQTTNRDNLFTTIFVKKNIINLLFKSFKWQEQQYTQTKSSWKLTKAR